MKISIKEYLSANPSYLVAAIILADSGEPEILTRMVGGERAAFDLLKSARQYGADASIWTLQDFPIALTEQGIVTKKIWRLAGLLIAKQEFFFGMKCNRGIEPESYQLSSTDKAALDLFIANDFAQPSPSLTSHDLLVSGDAPRPKRAKNLS